MAQGGGPGGGAGGGGSKTPEAATLVVSYLPGVGDYLTIQDAIDNLPVQGGYILVREGTYDPAILSNKPIIIRGCGRGSTVIDLGAADVTAFATGFFANKYVIRDLSVIGNPANIQQFLGLGGASEVLVENVEVTDVLQIVMTTSTPEVVFRDCTLTMPAAANATWWTNFFGPGGALTWDDVESDVPTPSGVLITGRPDFTALDSYSGGPPTISTCDVGKLVLQGFEYDHIAFTLNQPNSRVSDVVGTDVRFIMSAKGLSIVGSDFSSVVEASPMIAQSGMTGAINLRVGDCTFDGGALQQFMDLNAVADAALSAISVANTIFSNGATSFMALDNVTMSMTDCQSDFSVPFLSGSTITLIGSPTYAFTSSGALTATGLLTVPGRNQPVTKVTGQVGSASAGSNITIDLLLIKRSDGSTLATLGTLTIVAAAFEGTLFLTTPTDVTDDKALKAMITDPGSGTPGQDLVMLVS